GYHGDAWCQDRTDIRPGHAPWSIHHPGQRTERGFGAHDPVTRPRLRRSRLGDLCGQWRCAVGGPELSGLRCDGSGGDRAVDGHAVPGTAGGLSPAWHPSGRYVAYDELANTGHHTIMVRDLAAGTAKGFATNHTLNITPAFSPDGSTLAFAAGNDGTDIYAVNP